MLETRGKGRPDCDSERFRSGVPCGCAPPIRPCAKPC